MPATLIARLQSAGVRAGLVKSVRPNLFVPAADALGGNGENSIIPNSEATNTKHPHFAFGNTGRTASDVPCLGEHNDYVFEKIVGLSREEIEQLKNDGVIA